MIKLTMEKFEGDKYNPDSYHIEHGDFSTKKALSGFSIGKSGASRPDAPRYNYSIGFDLGKGGLPSLEKDPATLRSTITSLLDAAGIENYEFKGSVNSRDFSVVIKGAEAGTLTKVAGALSTDADLGKGATAYGIIDKNVALQVADLEAEALGPTGAYTLDKVTFTEGDREYLDYESNIPGAVVKSFQQDSVSAEIDGKYVKQEKTNIIFDAENKSAVTSALDKAGLTYKSGEQFVTSDEPYAKVAKVLTESGLLPKAANTEIQTALATMKQDFVTAAQVKAAGFSSAKPALAFTGNEM